MPDAPASLTLEICVDDPAGIAAATAGGADRIELCTALDIGGLTPSAALIDRAVATGLPIHVLVRPRSGDFVLAPDELAIMIADIEDALARGAVGVVVGAALPDGRLDGEALARFREAARHGVAVLNRVVDLTIDPVSAVDLAAGLGYDKVLSSGGTLRAPDGAPTLARMVAAAGKRLSVIAGAGVRPDNVAALVARTGVREVHSSARSAAGDWGEPVRRFGFAVSDRRHTDRAVVAALRAGLDHREER